MSSLAFCDAFRGLERLWRLFVAPSAACSVIHFRDAVKATSGRGGSRASRTTSAAWAAPFAYPGGRGALCALPCVSAASVSPVRLRTRLRLLSTTTLRGCRRGMPHCATSWTPCWSLCRQAGCATRGPFCFPVVPCLRGTGDGGGASAAAQYWRLERPGQCPRAASVPLPGFLQQP